MSLVVAAGLSKAYRLGGQRIPVLQDVHLSIDEGHILAVMGPSGCGKTTLLNCLSGIDDIDGGSIEIGGRNLVQMGDRKRTKYRAENMGFVFQAFHLVPVLTAQRNVELPLQLAGVSRSEATKRAGEALDDVGLGDRAGHMPNQLSGGQQQRVAIARALVNRPTVVWADEPTGNLDSASGQEVLDLFGRLNKERGTTFVVVTHDQRVAKVADRVINMDSGRIV